MIFRRVGGYIRDRVEDFLRDIGGWHIRRMAKVIGIGMLGTLCFVAFLGGIGTAFVLYLFHHGVPADRLFPGIALAVIFSLAPPILCFVWGPVMALEKRHSPEKLDACARAGWETLTGCLAILFFPVVWAWKKFWRRGGAAFATL